MHTVTLEEAQARLPDLVKEAATSGDILIVENEELVATLSAAPAKVASVQHGWPVIGMLKGRIKMAPDFDAPLEEFREYME
jgi:antitoxin (DNA-binding transcriptional repressor) of toxin-antitoxin stability system